jgi:coenzyme PQQ biosynthesis protein PqqD
LPDGLDDSDLLRFARGVKLRRDEKRGRWVLLAPERILTPDPVAVEILKRVDGTKSLSTIVDDLAMVFNAERTRIEADVRMFLGGLIEKGFVEARP